MGPGDARNHDIINTYGTEQILLGYFRFSVAGVNLWKQLLSKH